MNTAEAFSKAPLTVPLADVPATLAFGKRVGQALLAARDVGCPLRFILLFGELGSGKTTLTRGIVEALPGGENAEVSSPSFTVCNEYPTRPLVIHCDLYRDEDAGGFASGLPDEAWDVLERSASALVLVEWAQRLRPADLPLERLDIRLESCHEKHVATLIAYGEAAGLVIGELIRSGWSSPRRAR